MLQQYQVSDEKLALFRLIYALFWLYLLGVPYLGWVAGNPAFVFAPEPFLGLVLLQPPGPVFLHLVGFTTLGALCALLLGWKTYWASIMTTLLLMLTQALTFSFGKIDHTIVAVLVPFLLRNTAWGSRYSLDEVHRGSQVPSEVNRNENALLDLAIILGFAYWTAGVVKVYGGWLDLDLYGVYAYCTSFMARGDGWANTWLLQGLPLETYWAFWKSLDVITVIFELGFLIAIWQRRWLQWYILLALLFHLTIGLVLGITFWIHGLVFLAFFPPNVQRQQQSQSAIRQALQPKYLSVAALLITLWFIYFSVLAPAMPTAQYSSPIQLLLSRWTELSTFYLGMVSNGLILLLWIRALVRGPKDSVVKG